MPRPCRAAKGLECVFAIWFTQCGLVWFTLAMPCPCHAPTMPFISRPHCVNQMAKTHSKPLAARHGRGMGTACYLWIGLKGMKQNPSRNANCITLCDMVQCSFLRTISLDGRRQWSCLISDFHEKVLPPYLDLTVRFWLIRFWHSKSQATVLWSCN